MANLLAVYFVARVRLRACLPVSRYQFTSALKKTRFKRETSKRADVDRSTNRFILLETFSTQVTSRVARRAPISRRTKIRNHERAPGGRELSRARGIVAARRE